MRFDIIIRIIKTICYCVFVYFLDYISENDGKEKDFNYRW